MKKTKVYYFLFNLILCFSGFLFLVNSGFRFEDGQFAYPLDDSFIHLAMAKNIAFEGVWGVTSHEFSSTSSSPLFTVILSSLMKIFGNVHTLPLYLNAILLFLFIAYLNLKSYWSDQGHQGGIITIAVMIIALPINLAAMGMEHILQLLMVLLLIDRIVKKRYYLTHSARLDPILLFLILLAVSTRFESIFIIAGLCFLLLLRNKWKDIFVLTLTAFLPLILYGIFSLSNGSGFLPNSLLMKGHSGTGLIHTLYLHFGSFYKNLFINDSLAIFLIIPLLIQFFIEKSTNNSDIKILAEVHGPTIFALTVVFLHHFFAQVGWLYRYENYVLMITALSLKPLIGKLRNYWVKGFAKVAMVQKLVFIVTLLIFSSPFLQRFFASTKLHYMAQQDIYNQHIVIAKFVRDYLKPELDSPLAINDIGAICYYSDVPIFDIWGLATYEVTNYKHRAASEYIPEMFDKYDIEYGIYYEYIFSDFFTDWEKAGYWDIGERYVAAGSTVTFAGKNSIFANKMNGLLKNYEQFLPQRVKVKYPDQFVIP